MGIFPRVLSLCSGYGGLDLGIELAVGCRVVCYVERETYAASNLVARMEDKTLHQAPIWDDVKTFDGHAWRGAIDCITAGYPCQPFSLAGNRKGASDPRHIWPDIRRIVGEVRPQFCFFENVPNHLNMGFDTVSRDLQEMGYSVAATLVTAEEIGAPHKRERLFILANSKSRPIRIKSEWNEQNEAFRGHSEPGDSRGEGVAHSNGGRFKAEWGKRVQTYGRKARWDDANGCGGAERANTEGWRCKADSVSCRGKAENPEFISGGVSVFPPGQNPNDPRWSKWPWPSFEPGFRRNSHGSTKWNDRLRLCGNGVVPLAAAYAFVTLLSDTTDKGELI